MQKLFTMIIPVLLSACATSGSVAERLRAMESAIPGVPVPVGSVQQGEYDGGGGVVMIFYTHPQLEGGELLRFYERLMPEWGWVPVELHAPPPRQRSFERNGVPVLIGVEAEDPAGQGSRFSIIRGARGDWGFMPQLRKPQ